MRKAGEGYAFEARSPEIEPRLAVTVYEGMNITRKL
jgi:hypothetical protein